jgi:hypothetical protein
MDNTTSSKIKRELRKITINNINDIYKIFSMVYLYLLKIIIL